MRENEIKNRDDELSKLYEYDEQRFRKSISNNNEKANQTQLTAKLIFSSHSLEKSLSNDNFELGRGLKVVSLLVDILEVYRKKNYDRNHLAYISTISVLREFYERHKNSQFEKEIKRIVKNSIDEILTNESDLGGAMTLDRKDKNENSKKNFKELSEGRYAVRSYSDKPVSSSMVEEVIDIATKTPTVCNRQPVRVYAFYDKNIIKKILDVQGGIVHYETPPVLLLITADDSCYIDFNERNQGFIDGGLFAMSVLYAFEYKGLAACPLHAMFAEIPDRTIREMLDLSDSEKLITFISAGHFKEKNNVCKSFRFPTEHLLRVKQSVNDVTVEDIERIVYANPEVDTPDLVEVSEKKGFVLKIRRKIRPRTRLKQLKMYLIDVATLKIKIRFVELKSEAKYKIKWLKYTKVEGVILTLNGYFNYGNMVQRFALQEFLKQNDRRFVSYEKAPTNLDWEDPIKFQHTKKFVEKYIDRKSFDPRDNFPVYIVGSDQVWRNWGYEDEKSDLGYFFLNFTESRNVGRIAYAASIGQSSIAKTGISDEFVSYIEPYIKNFDAISMREKSGAEVVSNIWQVDVDSVIDPTLLLSKETYEELIVKSSDELKQTENTFVYTLHNNQKLKKKVQELSKSLKKGVTEFRLLEYDVYPPVEQWLSGFRDAEFIITDSFHGTVFSIIFNKDFVVIDNSVGGTSRLTDLCEQLGISGRIIDEDTIETFDISSLEPINWEKVNHKIDILREQSSQWLMQALRSAKYKQSRWNRLARGLGIV